MPEITPLGDAPFGAEVTAFDCATFDKAAIEDIREALHRHQLLVFRNQQGLTPHREVALCRAIDHRGAGIWRDQTRNPWEVYKVAQGNQAGTYQLPAEPAVLVIGNGDIDHYGLRVTLGGDRGAYGKDEGSQVLGGGALQWHIDGAFYAHPPCNVTQMRCIEAPSGSGHWVALNDGSEERIWCEAGSTAFASGRIAFELLPAETRESSPRSRAHYAINPFQAAFSLGNSANGLRAVDTEAEARYRRGEDAPGGAVDDPLAQVYPLVWTCPVTARQALMPHPRCLHSLEIADGNQSRFLGVIESRLQVEQWMRPAIAPEHVYVHAWRPGDLALWHNRSLWHSATGKLSRDDRRVMHLTAFNGSEAPICEVG